MNTFQHATARQIKQLEKYDPAAARRAAGLLAHFPAHARKITTDALTQVLARLNSPAHQLWQAVERTVATGITLAGHNLAPAQIGRMIDLGVYGGQRFQLFCDRNYDWRLTAPYRSISGPLIRWGRDDSAISSPQAGKWRFHSEARANFDEFVSKNSF